MPGMACDLHIKAFMLGMWQTNCYVLWREGRNDCWIVDAGFQPAPLIEFVRQASLNCRAILLTHAHCDHIGGLEQLCQLWPEAPVWVHPAETEFLTDPDLNLSGPFGMPITAPAATGSLEHGQALELDGLVFEVRHTPGHSPGGVTLYQADNDAAIVGDTLFAGSIGRYDFPTSDGPTLMRSIREQLLSLPQATTIYPGHGPISTIGQERANNPFLRD